MAGHLQTMLSLPGVKIPILTYHSIDQTGSVISVGSDQFQHHMRWLASAGYSVVSLRDVMVLMRQGSPIPPNTIALSFDDGFKNFSSSALPVLQELGFRATVFLVVGQCGFDKRGTPHSSVEET